MDRIIRKKSVSISQLIKTLIICLCFALVCLIPIMIDPSVAFFFETLPFIGHPEYLFSMAEINYFAFMTQIGAESIEAIRVVASICTYGFQYSVYAFFGILILNILFALLLLIIRANVLRVIFKVFSIIFGILSIVMATFFLIYIAALVTLAIMGADLMTIAFECLGIHAIVMFALSIVLATRQFKWYSRP